MRRLAKLFSAAAALAACPTIAHAQNASGGVRITVTVPEVCQIESVALVSNSDGVTSGTVFEMCNGGRGFRVVASHRTLASGEQVQINYAGQIRLLDSSGVSDVAQRSSPIVGTVPVTIESSGLVQSLAISLGVAVI
jgi:hypothetical protein